MRLIRTTDGVGRIDGDEVAILDVPHPDVAAMLADDDLDPVTAAVRDRVALTDAVVLAPIDQPATIVIVGLNYHAHAAETGAVTPETPMFVPCPGGPGITGGWDDPIRLPSEAPAMVDYEGELGVVIGRTASEVSAANAWNHVGGLTVVNDVSARDVQREAMKTTPPGLGLSKTFPTFKPCGQAVVTVDELDTSTLDLELTTMVNGDERQRGRTGDLIFDIPSLIEAISKTTTLLPGDLICTGTPGGVGAPHGTFLQPGDIVEIAIEELGPVRNTVVAGG